ncbi:MAG: hypothetical protein K9G41_03625 [Flavobacteriales bacterium]|nr:hypothetical protein [Flavobacteriales bacterium]
MGLSQRIIALKNAWHFFRNEKVTRKRIVILLLPSIDLISGGVISVVSIYRELKRLEEQLGIHVFLSSHPQAPHFGGYTQHNTDVKIYGFYQLLEKLLPNSTILFHIPESHVIQFCRGLQHEGLDTLKQEKNLTYDINILNQNPDFFPDTEVLNGFTSRIREITQTTAHYAYNKPFQLGDRTVPSSYLGTYPNEDIFKIIPYEKKRNTIIVSHDEHPQKETILRSLQNAVPDLEIIVVKNMTLEEYTDHQKYCKFGLSFGEGMDAYFLQTILFGGIGFAVYNTTFFTEDIRAFPTVFDSFDQMHQNIASLIQELNTAEAFTAFMMTTRSVARKYYNHESYLQRIEHIHSNWTSDKGCIATKEILGEVVEA